MHPSHEFDTASLKSYTVSSSRINLDQKKTDWTSLWFANLILYFCGLQMSLYFTSMWPYLLKLDPTAQLPFFGIILASFSIGQAVGSPIFGTWTQKTETFKVPVATGLLFCCVGNILYGILPTLNWEVQWLMLVSRVLIGFGAGNLSALRAYVAATSTLDDRNTAVSLATGSQVTGMLTGPILQTAFAFIGDGTRLFNTFDLDAYTSPAFAIAIVLIIISVMIFFYFSEDYAGVIDEKKDNPDVIIPPFDRRAAIVSIYLWFVIQTIAVNIESLCSVFTIAMYNWTSHEAIVFGGYIETASCALSVSQYLIIGLTRVGKIDKRIQILFGCVVFSIYYLVLLPWPFYTESLQYNPNVTDGACTYEWCQYVPKIPFVAYILVYVLCFGIAFPYIGNSIGTLFSEVLGPRQQGTMQGIFAFFGSVGRCLAPLVTTFFFNSSGYVWVSIEMLTFLILGALSTIFYWKRMVPLKLIDRRESDVITNINVKV
uniref:MFS domain-containing protein n=1 Tax=Caenorhabditis japonica TaxID=281687 RepID=A0A8R1DGJ4_CAEJA